MNRKRAFCIIGQWFYQNVQQIVLTRGRTLNSTIMVAFRHVKWEKASLPVDVGRSKASLLKFPNDQHIGLRSCPHPIHTHTHKLKFKNL